MSPATGWTSFLDKNKKLNRRQIIKSLLVATFFVVVSVFILEIQFFDTPIAQLREGEIASENITSPASISFESPLATEAERVNAESRVTVSYHRADPEVLRKQRTATDQVFNFLDAIRADPYANVTQKLDWIREIQPVSLTQQEGAAILNLSEEAWIDAKREIRAILDVIMRESISEGQLITSQRKVGLRISSDVPDEEARVIIAIGEDLIKPNTFVDEVRTAEERKNAREVVPVVIKTLAQNEVVVRQGERITAEDIEALQALGLQEPRPRLHRIVSTFIWLTILVTLLGYYIVKYHPHILKDDQKLGLLVVIFLIFIIALRIVIPSSEILAYTLPTAALAIIIAGLLDPQLALIASLMMALVEAYVGQSSLELMAYVIISGFVVSLTVNKMPQLNTLLWAGLYTTVSNICVILVFRFFENSLDFVDILNRLGGGLLSGVLSAGLPVFVFFIVGSITNMITYPQLLELSKPTHPLLSELLRRAPGTYHHSLLVSNLAEQAAERIGADAFLCRIGAYYHDVGKMMRPYFFTENTPPGGASLHHNLDPETSAQIIISHVTDGLVLAKKHRLPAILHAFIGEHHGTEVTGYFYQTALKMADGDDTKVDKNLFTYPGPKPQSKETAILMLADASEATVRSLQPHSAEEIDQIVRRTIANRMKSGQFDECELTMQDLEQIRIAFNDVLQGISHPRIKYPDEVKKESSNETVVLPPLPLAVQSPHPTTETKQENKVNTEKYPIQRD